MWSTMLPVFVSVIYRLLKGRNYWCRVKVCVTHLLQMFLGMNTTARSLLQSVILLTLMELHWQKINISQNLNEGVGVIDGNYISKKFSLNVIYTAIG